MFSITDHMASMIKAAEEKKAVIVSFSGCGLFDHHMQKLVELLKIAPSIKRVDLSRNNISAEGAACLSALSLEAINLSRNNMSVGGLSALRQVVESAIIWLDLSHNGLEEEAAKMLTLHSKQSYLNLDANWSISAVTQQAIEERVAQNSKLSPELRDPFNPYTVSLFSQSTHTVVTTLSSKIDNCL